MGRTYVYPFPSRTKYPPGWMRISKPSSTPIMCHSRLKVTHFTNDEAKTHRGLQLRKDEAGAQAQFTRLQSSEPFPGAGGPPQPLLSKGAPVTPSKHALPGK